MTGMAALCDAYVGLGANLGDRAGQLAAACRALAAVPGLTPAAASPVYEGPAHTRTPGEVQPPYLNAVVHLRCALSAPELLAACLRIEARMGRSRSRRWAPRPLDLDLLVFGHTVLREPGLTVPHPRLGMRRFVLRPLADLAPNLFVPLPYDTTVADLLARCPDPDVLTLTPHRLPVAAVPGGALRS